MSPVEDYWEWLKQNGVQLEVQNLMILIVEKHVSLAYNYHLWGYRNTRCSAQVILQEIDRLLRPGGFALFRDHKDALLPLQTIAKVLHWKAHIGDTESGMWGTDKLLHCQKTRWTNSSKPE